MMLGVDISNHQAGINLNNIKADFIIAKATEGIGFVDWCCDGFIQWAINHNKSFGFYHFARPRNDAIKEARFFYEHTKNYFGKGIPILDWEDEYNLANVKWAKTWLDEVYRLSGVRPMIYMSESVENDYDWSSVVKGNYGLWLAKYISNKIINYNYDLDKAGPEPKKVHWPFYAMWQFTGKGRLDGFSRDIDCDVFYGDVKTWNAYAGIKTEPIHKEEPKKDDTEIKGLQAEIELLKKERTITYAKINDVYNDVQNAFNKLKKLLEEVK